MLALIIAAMVLPALDVPGVKASADTAWTSMANMPTARAGLGVAVVNGKIYAIGGTDGSSSLNTNEQYNPSTNQWTSETPMPTARSDFAIAVFNNQIYVIGGTIGNGFVGNNEAYDPATNSWEMKTSMPTPRSELTACVLNDKIYLIGGKKYSNTSPYYNETGLTEIFDPSTNTWSTGSPLPTPVYGYASAVVDNKIHIIGGSMNSVSGTNAVNSNQVFDLQSGNWSLGARMPSVETYGAAAATKNYMAPTLLYFMGGFFINTFSDKTQVYDLNNDSWTYGPAMPTPRAYLGVAVVDDIFYAIGGYDGINWLNTVEQYKPIGYGTIPPQVQITSPENKTYTKTNLAFNINRPAQWMGYSLDNQANATIQGQTPLENLTQGQHSIVIYVNDSYGNTGSSNIVWFSIDTIPPNITILIPQNQTYGSTDIELSFQINEQTEVLSYSLDGNTNITIVGNVTLPALSNGAHNLTLYATDLVGNADSATVSFSIEPFPTITVIAAVVTVIIVVAAGYLFFKRRKPEKQPNQTS